MVVTTKAFLEQKDGISKLFLQPSSGLDFISFFEFVSRKSNGRFITAEIPSCCTMAVAILVFFDNCGIRLKTTNGKSTDMRPWRHFPKELGKTQTAPIFCSIS
jgi:hypothetical protein